MKIIAVIAEHAQDTDYLEFSNEIEGRLPLVDVELAIKEVQNLKETLVGDIDDLIAELRKMGWDVKEATLDQAYWF